MPGTLAAMTTAMTSPGTPGPVVRPRPLTGWLHAVVRDAAPLSPEVAATLVEYAVDRGQLADFVAAVICRPEIDHAALDRIRAHVDVNDSTIAAAFAFRQTATADAFAAAVALDSGLRPVLRVLDEDYLHAVTSAIAASWERTADLPNGEVAVLCEVIARTGRIETQTVALQVIDQYATSRGASMLQSFYLGALQDAAPAAVAGLAVTLRTIHAVPTVAAAGLPADTASHLARSFVLPQIAALPTHTEKLSVEQLTHTIARLLAAWPADVAADVFTAASSTQLPLPTARALTGPFVTADTYLGRGVTPQIDWGQWPLDSVLAAAAPAGQVRAWLTRALSALPAGVTLAQVDQLAGSFKGTFNELLEVLAGVALEPAA